MPSDHYLGEIALFPYNFTPRGWAPCNGQLLPINQHHALFVLLGTTFGGDGRRTFGLPNLPSEGNLNRCIALDGIFPPRD